MPDPDQIADEAKRLSKHRALKYMGLTAGTKITDIKLDRVFIGSCTNGRIEDLRAAAKVADGKTVNGHVNAMIVPGSGIVKEQAEAEGLDKIFLKAGFEWREPGCSMCLAMNPDKLSPEERCASTSNRNFEGRQGFKGRTHLVSPAMAAAAAIAGHFVDIRDWRKKLTAPCLNIEAFSQRRVKARRADWLLAGMKFREEPAMADKPEFVDLISEATRQVRRTPCAHRRSRSRRFQGGIAARSPVRAVRAMADGDVHAMEDQTLEIQELGMRARQEF